MAFEDRSIEMAKRLKKLRIENGLSHEKLAKDLSERYGIRISKDSLINYEIADKYSERKFPNNGMKVEYLRCFADFYGVSADYLLGLTEPTVTSPDMEVRAICEKTGLSDTAVRNLMVAHEYDLYRIISTIDTLLQSEDKHIFLFGESDRISGENVFSSIAEFLYAPILKGHFLISEDGSLTESADHYTDDNGAIFIPHGFVGSMPKREAIERFQINRIVSSLKSIRQSIQQAQEAAMYEK